MISLFLIDCAVKCIRYQTSDLSFVSFHPMKEIFFVKMILEPPMYISKSFCIFHLNRKIGISDTVRLSI